MTKEDTMDIYHAYYACSILLLESGISLNFHTSRGQAKISLRTKKTSMYINTRGGGAKVIARIFANIYSAENSANCKKDFLKETNRFFPWTFTGLGVKSSNTWRMYKKACKLHKGIITGLSL